MESGRTSPYMRCVYARCLIADRRDTVIALLGQPFSEGFSRSSERCVKGHHCVNRWISFRTGPLPRRLRCWLSALG